MLITDDGRWEGAISGGCLEGDALRKARQVVRDNQPIVVVATVLKSCAPTGPLVSDRFVLTENPVQPVPDWLTAVLEQLTITKRTAAVLMSHNFHYDRKVLESLLVTDVPYTGMLGPRKRFGKMQAEFERDGFSVIEASLERVHAPIGLDIGAETPDEIALSTIGEIKAFFTNRSGGFLKSIPGPIHERTAYVESAHSQLPHGVGSF